MRRWLLVLLALSIGVNVGWGLRTWRAADGSPPPDPGRRPGGPPPRLERILEHHLERMEERLALSGSQLDALRSAHRVLFPPLEDASRDVERLRDASADAFRESPEDAQAFRELTHDLRQAQARLDSLLTEVLIAEVSVLQGEQRERYLAHNPWSDRQSPDGERPPGPRPGPRRRGPPGGI